ncbi:MAG: hypothetical protein AAF629_23490 [Chloroflexota bacterium]
MSCASKAKTFFTAAIKTGITAQQTLMAYLTGMKKIVVTTDKQNSPIDFQMIPQLEARNPANTKHMSKSASTSSPSPLGPLNDIGSTTRTTKSARQSSITKTIRLRERPVQVVLANLEQDGRPQIFQVDQAFEVLMGDRPTGMALTPKLNLNTGESTDQWNVTHIDTGMSIATDFADLEQAQTLAEHLSHIDWHTPFEQLPQTTLNEAKRVIQDYEQQLASVSGDTKTQAWRKQDLSQQLVNDGLGDVAYVIEDLGDQVRLSNTNGPYLMPRNMLCPLNQADYQAHKIAQPLQPATGERCHHCQKQAYQDEAYWYRIQDQTTCDACATPQAEKAGYVLPEDIETKWKRN